MKTTFSRQFALIAALLLVCMLFTGVSFRFLMLRYLKNDKKETLSADAQAVASLAEAYDSTGELEENWDFRLSLSLFSDVGEAEAQVCDENGFVVLCSCDEFNCEHLGRQIDADLITEIDMNGETFRVGTLTGIHDGRRYIAGRPIVSDDTEQTIGYVIISSDMSQITDFMQRSSSLFFYSAIIVLVLSMAAATFLSHQQVQPLNKVAEAARRFGRGELDTRVEVPKSCGEEIVDLANAFNTMADSLEKSEQRRQEFVANVSHELKTPIALIQGYAEGLKEGINDDEESRNFYCDVIMDEAVKMNNMVKKLLTLNQIESGNDKISIERFDLVELAGSVIRANGIVMNQKEITVDFKHPDTAEVWADQIQMEEVFTNYLTNAVNHCDGDRKIIITIEKKQNSVYASVYNTGHAIPEEDIERIWEKFYKVDKARTREYGGNGIGLSIVKAILDNYKASYGARNLKDGVEFWFDMPVHEV